MVLADDAGQRAMPLWLRARAGQAVWSALHGPGPGGPDLARRLVEAAGGAVTRVDIDELGPGVLAGRIEVTGPAGPALVTAHLGQALAMAAAAGAPVRVAGPLWRRLAVPVPGDDLLGPFLHRIPERAAAGLASAPWNLDFGAGLDGWLTGGSFRAEPTGSHWQDYAATAADGTATLASAVPRPYGEAFLGQAVAAGAYRGATVTFSARLRVQAVTGRAELTPS